MTMIPIENSLALPDCIDEDGLIVGWSLEREPRRRPIGFKFGAAADPASAVIDPTEVPSTPCWAITRRPASMSLRWVSARRSVGVWRVSWRTR